MKKGINRKPGDPNYDLFKLALKSTAKRLYPNYANGDVSMQKDWIAYDRKCKREVISSLSENDKEVLISKINENPELKNILMLDYINGDLVVTEEEQPIELYSTMGCRTINGADINAKDSYIKNIKYIIEGKGLYDDYISAAQKDGRGNIAPATIILPTLAMEAREAVDKRIEAGDNITNIDGAVVEEFMDILGVAIEDCKDGLIERFNHIASQPEDSADFMYKNNTMTGYVPEEGIISALRHGTLAIGQLALAEAIQILIGCDHTDELGMVLAERIETLFRDRCKEYKEKYKLNFGVYYTPAENLCYTAMNNFKETYGEIPNVSDKPFFTNSIHVPVWKKISPFEKIDIESKLVGFSSAGCITYIELDSTVTNNIDAIEVYVNYAMDHDIPYFAINVPNDTCLNCGYIGEFNNTCPICNSKHIQRLRRVTGYLTGDFETAFNPGKVAETKMRYQHTKRLIDPKKRDLI